MENLSILLLAVLAFGICTWGLILLIRMLKGMEDGKLKLWLDFIKVFLGTFVVGLLGYFAKVSFDNRNLAILESDQIGQYVEQAMVDDLEVRLRFADYFNTVLPKESRKTGWQEYYERLEADLEKRDRDLELLEKDMDSLNSITRRINEVGKAKEEDVNQSQQLIQKSEQLTKQFEQISQRVNKKQIEIELTEKIIGSKNSSHASIIEIYTYSEYDADRITINKRTVLPPGRVHMACRVFAPKAEMVTITWRDDAQTILHSKRYPISINKDDGYKLYSYKTFTEEGDYSVEVVNGIGEKIGVVNFEIKASR